LKTKPESPKKLWRQRDSVLIVKTLMIGLAVGMTVRWLNASTPLPVQAAELRAANTNAPAEIRIEGVSPSVRD
jgi:cytochrome c-type biogenesis protein CcmE